MPGSGGIQGHQKGGEELLSVHHSKSPRSAGRSTRSFRKVPTVTMAAVVIFGALAGAQLFRTTAAGASPPHLANSVTFTSVPQTISSSSSQVLGVIGTSYTPTATARSG